MKKKLNDVSPVGAVTRRREASAAALLNGLALRAPDDGWVEPFAFSTATNARLRKWLDEPAILALQLFVQTARQIETDDRNEATIGESRAVLERIHDLAAALSMAITRSPDTTKAELDLIGYEIFRESTRLSQWAAELNDLSLAARRRAEEMPRQSRRQSHTHLISGIAEVAERCGIKVSASAYAQFFELCRCVFDALNIPQDPRGSITAYLGHARHNSSEKMSC